jgi:uncharacterized protein
MNVESKIAEWLESHPKVLVALSGGVDSSLLAFLTNKILGKENAQSVIGISPSLKERDLLLAREFCARYDITLQEIDPGEMSDESYVTNPVNRCYFCKTALYTSMNKLVSDAFKGYEILNGNNATDLSDYRPGKKAAEEKHVFSPLADCGITKEEIRAEAKRLNLQIWNKPASPCLSSRVAYGEMITVEKLKMIEKAENYLSDHGFSDVRVRYYPGKVLIEVPKAEIPALQQLKSLDATMQEIGLPNWHIDKEGLVSGKLNRSTLLDVNK